MANPLVIVLTGPESTGKSELTEALAKHYQAPLVREYAREYLEAFGPKYDYAAFRHMYEEHCKRVRENQTAATDLLFVDTDGINFWVWAQEVFGLEPSWLKEGLAKEQQHHYLLSYHDVPWQPDPLRTGEASRPGIFAKHRQKLDQLGRPYRILRGLGPRRLKNALAIVEFYRRDR